MERVPPGDPDHPPIRIEGRGVAPVPASAPVQSDPRDSEGHYAESKRMNQNLLAETPSDDSS